MDLLAILPFWVDELSPAPRPGPPLDKRMAGGGRGGLRTLNVERFLVLFMMQRFSGVLPIAMIMWSTQSRVKLHRITAY